MKISYFRHEGRDIGYIDVAEAIGASAYARLPFVKRVLLENVFRNAQGDVDPLILAQGAGDADAAYPLRIPRIILPDSSGLPVLMDLASLRSELHRNKREVSGIGAEVPIDLIVDHSLQVDYSASPDAVLRNLDRELHRNRERYAFLKWAQQAFPNLRVFPPGSGIIHQIHIEQIARVTLLETRDGQDVAYPDFAVGGDSHTPMVNALGVPGWGVGGIEAETVALGQYYILPAPPFVGVRIKGQLRPGVTMTDAALAGTQILRAAGVVGSMLEFFGPGASTLSVPDRATLANMAPEYGATMGFWPVDQATLGYLHLTGREESHVKLVEAHMRAAGLFREDATTEPDYDRIIEIDLSAVGRSVAGPGKPHLRKNVSDVAASFWERADPEGGDGSIPQGAIAIAAITSCTNTANPDAMIRAGLLARNAANKGLKSARWVKTSLAPGSRAVTQYLEDAGLMPYLEALGFHVVGYGCTTCGGKSGPLSPDVVDAVEKGGVNVAAVLSGNRNFDGRIHRLVSASYLCAPALVVAYGLAGVIDIDLDNQPLGAGENGQPVMLADIWPSDEEVRRIVAEVVTPQLYKSALEKPSVGKKGWDEVEAHTGPLFPWDKNSSYVVEPPFFHSESHSLGVPDCISGARVIGMFGDGLTTDHISPSGEIPLETPAGRYLTGLGIARADFNTYVGRRGNHHVMVRGTYANIRLRNRLAGAVEGSWTRVFPEGEEMDIFAASEHYRQRNVPAIVLAGANFGVGSSRDWAAKGQALLGIVAILAGSFERIHRSNLIGMGILPLTFRPGQDAEVLGLAGDETFAFEGVHEAVSSGTGISVEAVNPAGRKVVFEVALDARSKAERDLLAAGGIFRAARRVALDVAPPSAS